jgi:hypothetical protein
MKIKPIVVIAMLLSSFLFEGCEENVIEKPISDANTAEVVEEAGLPLAMFPQIKTISKESFASMKDLPETGVFLIDGDYLPHTFKDELKTQGLTLQEDGSLVNAKGNKMALFVSNKLCSIKVDDNSNGRVQDVPDISMYSYYAIEGGCIRDMVAKTTIHSKKEFDKLTAKVETEYDLERTASNVCYDCKAVSAIINYRFYSCWRPSVASYHSGKYKYGNKTGYWERTGL